MNHSASSDLFARAEKVLVGGVNSPVRAFRAVGGSPFFTAKANGARLTTADGCELIDYVCTWGPAIHGHNDPDVREAIALALQNGTSFGTPNPAEVTMAELLVELVPSIEKVRMVNSGTEATMSAIRLARGVTGRSKIIKFSGCYHGHSDSLLVSAGSGALTLGTPDSAGVPPSFAEQTIVLPFNDAQALREAFATHGADIAGVIVEAYPANCGLILPLPEFYPLLRELCTRNGSLLILDEVMTGFRIALGGVQQHDGLEPDLTALGKIIGGGLPVGAFGGRAELMDHLAPLGPVYQAGTLSGNPLAMAAGIAALTKLLATNPYARLDAMGQRIATALKNAAASKGLPLQVPQRGSMFSMYFSEQRVDRFEQAPKNQAELFRPIFRYCLDNGVYLPPSAFETCFISTAHSEADIDRTCEILAAAIAAL